MAQKLGQPNHEFLLTNFERDMKLSSGLRAKAKQPFSDEDSEKTFRQLIEVHGRLAQAAEKLKSALASNNYSGRQQYLEITSLLKDYADKALPAIERWQNEIAKLLGMERWGNGKVSQLTEASAVISQIAAVRRKLESVYKKYDATLETLPKIRDIGALKEILMADKAYEQACLKLTASLRDDFGMGFKELQNKSNPLFGKFNREESYYARMTEGESRLGISHQRDNGTYNLFCREAFLVSRITNPDERLKLQAEIFLTRDNLYVATADELTLDSYSMKQQRTLRTLIYAFTEKIEEAISTGKLSRRDFSKETFEVAKEAKKTAFYAKTHAAFHREPEIWDSIWLQNAAEKISPPLEKTLDFLFPLTSAAFRKLDEEGSEERSAAQNLAWTGAIAGASFVDAASLVFLRGAGKAIYQTGKKVLVEQGLKQVYKKTVEEAAGKIAVQGAVKYGAKKLLSTSAKTALLAWPYYHSYQKMTVILENENSSFSDKALAASTFIKEVLVTERVVAKGPAAIAESLKSLRKFIDLARFFENHPKITKVFAFGATMAVAVVLSPEYKAEESLWKKEYRNLKLSEHEKSLLPMDSYLKIRAISRDNKGEKEISLEKIKITLEEYPSYVRYCNSEKEKPLGITDYAFLRLNYSDKNKDDILKYTQKYGALSPSEKASRSFTNFFLSQEIVNSVFALKE